MNNNVVKWLKNDGFKKYCVTFKNGGGGFVWSRTPIKKADGTFYIPIC
jgi:hypothetical protein